MLFDSPVYLFFLAVVTAVYWALSFRRQNAFLLAVSYFFYGWWDWRFLSLIVLSTLVDFYCAKAIAESEDPRKRRGLLIFSVTLNLGFLGFFKYMNFFAESLHGVLAAVGVDVPPRILDVVLPPGISFYTFQALAYMVDVYFRRLEPSKSLLDYGLFISLFPHLIAGPIQRPGHLLPQTQNPREFNGEQFFSGLQLICYGFLKKCVVADGCAVLSDAAFNGSLGPKSLPVLLLGAYAFAWQIYGDFAGYSDIARGSAQLMGFHFMVNFRQPYLSTSLQDFWRRWHISLSTWLRDYLYIPLGGNRGGTWGTYRNLFATMVIGGFWHGANWTFVIWGAIHGAWLAIERILLGSKDRGGGAKSRLGGWVACFLTFHVVCVAWVFFRATSIASAFEMLGGATTWYWRSEYFTACLYLAFFAAPMVLMDQLIERGGGEYPFQGRGRSFQIAAAAAAVFLTILFSANKANVFIYFQF